MKMVVAILAMAALVVVFLVVYKRMFPKKTGNATSPVVRRHPQGADGDGYRQDPALSSAQQMLGLRDIIGTNIIMADDSIINLIKVECRNTSLFTEKEKVAEARHTAAVFAGQDRAFSIVQIHRQVDNSRQTDELGEILAGVNADLADLARRGNSSQVAQERAMLLTRRTILMQTIASEMQREQQFGRQVQAETFICLKTPTCQESLKVAHDASAQLIARLADNNFRSELLGGRAVIDVLRAYFDHPATAAENIDPEKQVPLAAWRTEELKEV